MAASDRTLLDRLNALKPSGISLSAGTQIPRTGAGGDETDSAALASSTATTVPVTREDALAARLRTLRHGHDDAQKPAPRATGPAAAGDDTSQTSPEVAPAVADDQALDDLLLALAATGLDDEDAEETKDDGGLLPLPDVPTGLDEDSGEDEDTEKKVAELLRDLGGPEVRRSPGAAVSSGGGDADDSDDSDDSDGETMGRDVKDVLAQAKAEAELARGQEEDGEEEGSSAAADPSGAEAPPDRTTTGSTDDVLALPAVPTKLVDLLPPTGADNDDTDVDSSISVRLAALRGLHGKAAGLGQTDAFGLPSAPTFQPGEAPAAAAGTGWRRNVAGVRYSDADQQTWCIVCLEDADVRCLGCSDDSGGRGGASNNAYCTRCWREMHVGPAAGFDERGHQRVPLVRRPQS